MAEYSLTTPTPVPVGGAIPYNNTIIPGCCNIRHRAGSGTVKVKGGTCCKPNKYYIQFHGNITGVTNAAQVGIYLDGELLPETVMNVVLPETTSVLSVDSATEIAVDGCFASVSVRVVAGTNATMNTANIIVRKIA